MGWLEAWWMQQASRRAGVVTATPDSLSGLLAWGEGSDLGADGSAVSTWLNKTGSGIDAAQGTGANQPTVKANAINGQKAVKFDGTNDVLLFPAGALSWFQNVPGATIAAVVQPLSTGSSQRIVSAEVNGSAATRAQLAIVPPTYTAASRRLDADTSSTSTSGTPGVGTSAILTTVVDYVGGTVSLSVNGATPATMLLSSSGGNTSNTLGNGVALGAASTAAVPFNGYLAAYAMWPSAISRLALQPILLRWSLLYGVPLG